MTALKTEDLSSAASSPVVLDMLLLDLVDQVQWLVVEARVRASVIGSLEKLDLASLCVVVQIQKTGYFVQCISWPSELLLDQG